MMNLPFREFVTESYTQVGDDFFRNLGQQVKKKIPSVNAEGIACCIN